MKHLLLAVLLLASPAFADTPEKIAADYREKAAAALTKVNETLQKAIVPIVADLIKSGDTATADLLREQMRAKAAGDPVDKPLNSIAPLFKSYDGARVKALEPVQKAAISRIDAALASSDGKKLEIVTELGKVRAEIESGHVELAEIAGAPSIESRLKRTKWSWGVKPEGGTSTLTFGLRKTLQVNQDVQHPWSQIGPLKVKWDDDTVMTFADDLKTFQVKMPDGSARFGKLLGKVEG